MRHLATILALFLAVGVALGQGGWLTSIEAQADGGEYRFTNNVVSDVESVYVAWPSGVANTATISVVNFSGSITNDLLSRSSAGVTNILFTPDGGAIRLMIGWQLRVSATSTNPMFVTLNRSRPQ